MIDDEKIFTDEQIGVDLNIAKKIGKPKPIISSIKFVKKHKLMLIIASTALIVVVTIFFLLPEITIGKTSLVNLNTSVKIKIGQTAKLKNGDVSVEIVNFINDACSKGATCFWSGQAVEYSLTIDGQKYATGSVGATANSDYQIKTESSDYKTYAIIKIIKSNEN